MKICVASIFRNSESYLQRYIDQVVALKAAAPQHEFSMVLAEGDSSDRTYERLKEVYGDAVFKREHGGPVFASVDNDTRWRQSSFVWEGVMERIAEDVDVVLYIECDLIWHPSAALHLISDLRPGVDMAACMVWLSPSVEYDIWGKRGMDGKCFGAHFPYHSELLGADDGGLYPISAAGSFIAMKGDVARSAHFTPSNLAIVGFCLNARELGYALYLDPKVAVEHPQ